MRYFVILTTTKQTRCKGSFNRVEDATELFNKVVENYQKPRNLVRLGWVTLFDIENKVIINEFDPLKNEITNLLNNINLD